jgi:divalent metal cation (Fe/Co/Zn/Cd) transporter
VVAISSIIIYSTSNALRININCAFSGDENISKIHEMSEKIEESVRQKFSQAIVTIHPEPTAPGKYPTPS